MTRFSTLIIAILLTSIMFSCKSYTGHEMQDLINAKAGTIITEDTINTLGIDSFFTSSEITEDLFDRINNKSYKKNSTIAISELRYLKLLHYDLNGHCIVGEIICNKAIDEELIKIFKELYHAKYPIEKIILIDEYNADDESSMSDNNSSCFNYREITGGGKLSKHALGLAIDINPLYNPYVKELPDRLHYEPKNSLPYINRSKTFPYKIDTADLCYKLFKQYGYTWGGEWETRKDYQHFEK